MSCASDMFRADTFFWFLRIAVCYHDSRSMLPIAFDTSGNHENIDIFVIFIVHFSCVLVLISCFFFHENILFWSFGLPVSYRYTSCMLTPSLNQYNR